MMAGMLISQLYTYFFPKTEIKKTGLAETSL